MSVRPPLTAAARFRSIILFGPLSRKCLPQDSLVAAEVVKKPCKGNKRAEN